MNWTKLIPTPDVLPAPWGIFEVLGVLTFVLHILFINVVVGGSLVVLIRRLRDHGEEHYAYLAENALAFKIPSLIALSVTLGVAPLLFAQVLYGHLFYASSVLMATFWILVIPILILGYYGAYLYAHRMHQGDSRSSWATIGIATTVVALLYVGFMFVNNMTLMLNPQEWSRYFTDRDGLLLNLSDPTVYSRYAHFLTASIAVSALFSAIIWSFRTQVINYRARVERCLRIFGIATMVQMTVGVWLLISLPSEFTRLFMGQNVIYTLVLAIAIVVAVAATYTAMRGRLWLTVSLLVAVALLMGTTRAFLRAGYVGKIFSFDSMTMEPQYGPMIAFLAVLLAGLVVVAWMIKVAFAAQQRRMAK